MKISMLGATHVLCDAQTMECLNKVDSKVESPVVFLISMKLLKLILPTNSSVLEVLNLKDLVILLLLSDEKCRIL